jgi:hypothetical protein
MIGVIEVERRGIPARLHYRIRWEKLFELLEPPSNFGGKRQTGLAETAKLAAQDRQS